MTSAVQEQLDTVQSGLNQEQTEACGKCAYCFLNDEQCDECHVGEAGCPAGAYTQMTGFLSLLITE